MGLNRRGPAAEKTGNEEMERNELHSPIGADKRRRKGWGNRLVRQKLVGADEEEKSGSGFEKPKKGETDRLLAGGRGQRF